MWLLPSVIATLTASLILALVYWFLYYQEKQRFMKIWAAGWLIYAIRFVFMLLLITGQRNHAYIIANQSAAFISGVFLAWGTMEFLGKRFNPRLHLVTVAGVIWIVAGSLLEFPFLLYTIPTFTFLMACFVWIGVMTLKSYHLRGSGRKVLGWSLILWGLHKGNYPFMRPVEWFAPWGYTMASVFSLTTAIGMLLVYFRYTKDMLEREVALRREAEQVAISSLEEKEVLLKEIHHRVKNNMQIISSLLSLQMGRAKDNELLKELNASRGRIQAMALVHEKLYMSEDLAAIDVEDYVSTLLRHLFDTYGEERGDRIRPVIDVNCRPIGIDTLIPCGLIITELVSNSLKYAFPGDLAGKIRVSFNDLKEGGMLLEVADDGKGISEEVLNDKGQSSLGLELVRVLSTQIGGTSNWSTGRSTGRSIDGGTCYSVRFPRDD